MPIPKHDPSRYRAMCEPHASPEDAAKAIEAFFEEVAELRAKYRIADVHVIAQTPCRTDLRDNGEGIAGLSLHLGDRRDALTMLARSYAQARKSHRDMLDRLLAMTDGPIEDIE